MSSVALTTSERTCLQHVRHYCAEGIGNKSGWARVGTPMSRAWTWDDIHSLVGRGLLRRCDTYMDVFVQPTEEGWAA